MRRVLLIADLEGITGVDTVDALVAGAPEYPEAAAHMTDEVSFVARRLLECGVQSIVISDSHRSGAATNLDASRLPPQCEVRVEEHDLYGGALLDGVEAVVCVGMHAGGTSAGFGAHTVSVNTAWELGGLALNESHLVRWLAAERGVPLWFVSGDDVLEAELGAERFVRTKVAVSRGQARSRPYDEVAARFEEVLRSAPPAVSVVPRGGLRVRFQRAAEAEAAHSAGHGVRVNETTLEFGTRDSFAAQYELALLALEAADAVLFSRVRGIPGTAGFARNAARLLLDAWD